MWNRVHQFRQVRIFFWRPRASTHGTMIMAENRITEFVEKQEWLDSAADTVQMAVASAFDSAGTVGQEVKDVLHGTWLGHPLHPALTDVPVGAWAAAVVMEAVDEM